MGKYGAYRARTEQTQCSPALLVILVSATGGSLASITRIGVEQPEPPGSVGVRARAASAGRSAGVVNAWLSRRVDSVACPSAPARRGSAPEPSFLAVQASGSTRTPIEIQVKALNDARHRPGARPSPVPARCADSSDQRGAGLAAAPLSGSWPSASVSDCRLTSGPPLDSATWGGAVPRRDLCHRALRGPS